MPVRYKGETKENKESLPSSSSSSLSTEADSSSSLPSSSSSDKTLSLASRNSLYSSTTHLEDLSKKTKGQKEAREERERGGEEEEEREGVSYSERRSLIRDGRLEKTRCASTLHASYSPRPPPSSDVTRPGSLLDPRHLSSLLFSARNEEERSDSEDLSLSQKDRGNLLGERQDREEELSFSRYLSALEESSSSSSSSSSLVASSSFFTREKTPRETVCCTRYACLRRALHLRLTIARDQEEEEEGSFHVTCGVKFGVDFLLYSRSSKHLVHAL